MFFVYCLQTENNKIIYKVNKGLVLGTSLVSSTLVILSSFLKYLSISSGVDCFVIVFIVSISSEGLEVSLINNEFSVAISLIFGS